MSELLGIVQEKGTCWVGAAFTDEDGNPVIPVAITYMIHDAASGAVVKVSTSVAPPAAEIEIRVAAAENAILDARNPYETRILTLSWTYGPAGAYSDNAEYRWRVKNLGAVT